MSKRSVKKTTHQQFDLLKFEMSKHPAAAIGYGVGTDRSKVDAEWKEIVVKLNEIGPPHRTITEWKKVWSDVRLRMKKRLSEQYTEKRRKNKKIRDESESEDEYFMDSINNSNSVYAAHTCPDNEEYDKPEIIYASCPTNVSVSQEEEYPMLEPSKNEDAHESTIVAENNSMEEDENHRSGKKTTTSEQFKLLKYEMSKHPAAALGYGAGNDRNRIDEDWREIVVKLNAIGPPRRTVPEWKKVWSDVRLRIKKRITSGKNRKRKDESESEEDLLMEALNNSIYASSHSCHDNEDYDEPEITHTACPPLVNVQHDVSGDNEEQTPVTVMESNPLEEDELNNVDCKKYLHRNFDITQLAESQYNDKNDRTKFMEHTLYTLQSQMEQHNKLLEHLSRISASVSGLMERHVVAMERKTQLLERQTKMSEYNDFLRRRQDTRKKLRGKIYEWF